MPWLKHAKGNHLRSEAFSAVCRRVGWFGLGCVRCWKAVKAQARYPLPSLSSPSPLKSGSGTSGTDFGA